MTAYFEKLTEKADATRLSQAFDGVGKPALTAQGTTLSNVCKLLRLDLTTKDVVQDAVFQHQRFKPGQHVYRMGQAFEALYVVNAGFLKTEVFDSEGNERVVFFPMKGDLLGSDGISNDRHASDVTALSDCDLIVIPFRKLLALGHSCKELEHIIYRAVSSQIVREHASLATLGVLRSDARVARFLSMQAEHHASLNYSSQSFLLRMTRREIGNYLGLRFETVSRAMSALDSAGIISVSQRAITILKPEVLRSFNPFSCVSTIKTSELSQRLIARYPESPVHYGVSP